MDKELSYTVVGDGINNYIEDGVTEIYATQKSKNGFDSCYTVARINMSKVIGIFEITPEQLEKDGFSPWDDMLAEPKRTCNNCKHQSGLSHNNGTMEYSGACKDCYDKNRWESNEI